MSCPISREGGSSSQIFEGDSVPKKENLLFNNVNTFVVDYKILVFLVKNPSDKRLIRVKKDLENQFQSLAEPMTSYIDHMINNVKDKKKRKKELETQIKHDLVQIKHFSEEIQEIQVTGEKKLEKEKVLHELKKIIESEESPFSATASVIGSGGGVITFVLPTGLQYLDVKDKVDRSISLSRPDVSKAMCTIATKNILTATAVTAVTHSAITWNRRQWAAGLGVVVLGIGGSLFFGVDPFVAGKFSVLTAKGLVEAASSSHSLQCVQNFLKPEKTRKRGSEEISGGLSSEKQQDMEVSKEEVAVAVDNAKEKEQEPPPQKRQKITGVSANEVHLCDTWFQSFTE